MDQKTFQFSTRGHCIKGQQYHRITITNKNLSLCSVQSSLFSFYAVPSSCTLKVQWPMIKSDIIWCWKCTPTESHRQQRYVDSRHAIGNWTSWWWIWSALQCHCQTIRANCGQNILYKQIHLSDAIFVAKFCLIPFETSSPRSINFEKRREDWDTFARSIRLDILFGLSVTSWLDYFSIFGHLQQWKLAQ